MVTMFWIMIGFFAVVGILSFIKGNPASGVAFIFVAGIMCTYFPIRDSVARSRENATKANPDTIADTKYDVKSDSYIHETKDEREDSISWFALVLWLIPLAIGSFLLKLIVGFIGGVANSFKT